MDGQATLIKRGELVIQANLRRSGIGLQVNIKVHPRVEELMRALGNGETIDAKLFGRYWAPRGEKPLEVYHLHETKETRGVLQGNGVCYRLDKPNDPLLDTVNVTSPIVNLSFLRLVGISEGAGVSFCVRGVYTDELIRGQLADHIKNAVKALYISFIKPIDVTVMCMTQEVPENSWKEKANG